MIIRSEDLWVGPSGPTNLKYGTPVAKATSLLSL
jgi:hypothetical protein